MPPAVDPSTASVRRARRAGVVGLLTLASRVLGLVRDAVVAALFRRGSTDAFFIAFTIPNMLRRLLAEGALTTAFIAVFTDRRNKLGEDAGREMFGAMIGAAFVTLVLVTLAGIGAAPWLVKMLAYGFADAADKLALTTLLTRVTFVYLVTVGLTALAMGALNTYGHFAAPAAAPVVLNICIITTVLVGRSHLVALGFPPVMALAVGVIIGGFAQVALQLPPLARRGLLVAPRFDFAHPGVRRVGWLLLPSIFGLAVYQLNIIVGRQFASFLDEGSVSYLYYAQRLIEFPIGIFAVAIATVAMPELSGQASAGDLERVKRTFTDALRLVSFVLLPATAGLVALAGPAVSVLFQRGAFTADMTHQTTLTVLGFTAGLWAAGAVKQVVPVFHALQDTRTPVKVSAVALVVYAVAAALLYRPLRTMGLALAVALASTVNFSLLLWMLRRRLGPLGLRSVAGSTLRSTVGAIVCGAVAYGIAQLADWTEGGVSASSVVVLALAVAGGIVAYAVVAVILRAPELRDVMAAVRRKRPRTATANSNGDADPPTT